MCFPLMSKTFVWTTREIMSHKNKNTKLSRHRQHFLHWECWRPEEAHFFFLCQVTSNNRFCIVFYIMIFITCILIHTEEMIVVECWLLFYTTRVRLNVFLRLFHFSFHSHSTIDNRRCQSQSVTAEILLSCCWISTCLSVLKFHLIGYM